jgi:pilus assembly protein CpaB
MVSMRQILVLAVALAAAIAAVFLINGMQTPQAIPEAAVEAPIGTQVLVAARDVPQGAPLTADDIVWRALPEEAVADAFVTNVTRPEALTDMLGHVTRRAIVAGEPIVSTAVIAPGEGGILAAQVPPGYRAVSVTISDASAAGGYLQPNDRVDVLLTTSTDIPIAGGGTRQEVRSDVILENVRVLAVGSITRPEDPDPEEGQGPTNAGTAVLELSQQDTRTIALAEELGELRLALRGVENEPPQLDVPSAQRWRSRALEQQVEEAAGVRIHAYGVAQAGE